jgi:hypothetical protein
MEKSSALTSDYGGLEYALRWEPSGDLSVLRLRAPAASVARCPLVAFGLVTDLCQPKASFLLALSGRFYVSGVVPLLAP